MALVLKDRVKESSSSSGTGNITLGGAFPGYQTFNAAIASGSTVYYTIHNLTAGSDTEWEVGVGTFTSPATLARNTVLSSSNSGSLVPFTSGVSGLEVFVTQPSEEAVYLNQATGLVEVGGNGTNTVAFTNINASNVVMVSGTISTNAANATDITNKTYVDGLFSQSISYHEAVLVESPTNLVAVYNQPNGAGNGVGATLTNSGANVALSIDGVSLSNTARVLVYTQSNAVQNGIYTVTNPGAPDPGGAQWVLTRATDADTYGLADPNKLGAGDAVFVQSGNTGAGETYVCTTAGTITFGSSNITFAQISSAQIYAAGTGLNLSNLTFSIANTAVTAATYGNAGAVATFTVNAQGQITNAANTSINASSITLGTLDNARTTAASANGANTIVLRDSTGSFTANTITATTSNATTFNGTTGAFTNVSGNGSAISAINASNISTGTIANARTTASTANSANTIVARDADGSFGANIITATFSGNAAGLSAINASNISSGTIANARTTAASANGASTIVLRDSGGSFDANTVNAVSLIGNAAQVTNINASNISTGTIANARTTASSSNGASTIVLRGASGEFAAGAITGASFSGNGAPLTDINASNISSGTIANARTTAASANGASTIVARDAGGNFSANTITATTFSGAHSGNGSALTDINASNISSGTIANARTTAASANGASTIVARDASGNAAFNGVTALAITAGGGTPQARRSVFTANSENFAVYLQNNPSTNGVYIGTTAAANTFVMSNAGGSPMFIVDGSGNGTFGAGGVGLISGNGSIITAINASNISTGTIANARTTAATANGASTIVLRGTSGEFSAGAITGAFFIGDGSNVSAINGSNVTTGTVANARTTAASANGASTIVARDANGSFTANVISVTTLSGGAVSGNGSGLTAINASNISSGTIANARTTASDANGASTIVSRDANGSFTANVVTATTFSGGGGSISAINASNISSGTIANARTTASSANGASTIVLRDAAGDFAADAITANFFIGDGSNVSAINASNISSGTVNTARISGSYTGITGVGTLTAGTWNATAIGAQYGGTGSANLTANNVILGNGASSVQFVAPGTNGNVLTSNGTTWVSTAAGGGVTLSDDTSTNATYYPTFATATSGTATTLRLSSTKLTYNPSTGNLVATIMYASSDINHKTDIQLIPDALVKVSQINGVTYIRTDNDQNIRHAGVIAQEVEKVLPEVIGTDADGYKVVAYGNMIGLLVEAIKELKAEVDALKGK